jgi:hypothetical protein
MGLLGKTLAIFNVLAAIGFLVVAVMDYGKQRAWSTLVFQQDLLLNGLPLDDTEKDADGDVISQKIGAFTLQQLMTGGQPVTTQLAEVKQRQTALQGAITQAGGEPEQRQKLGEILLPLATTYGEREELKRRIATEPLDQLMGDEGPFKAAFREASEGKTAETIQQPGAVAGAPAVRQVGEDLRKQAIAHLLYNLGDKPETYDQRLQGVIGVKAFLAEVTNQVAVSKELVDAYEHAIHDESHPFEMKDRHLISQIVSFAQRLQEQREILQKQEFNRDQHKTLVNKRQQDITEMQAKIDGEQKILNDQLARQKFLEDALAKANQEATQTSAANKALEQQIRSREIGR